MKWVVMLMFSSAPLAFFSEEISNFLDNTTPILGVFVLSFLMLWNAFVFGMTVKEVWKEWKEH